MKGLHYIRWLGPAMWPAAVMRGGGWGGKVRLSLDIIRFRLLMIAAGYEDGNDASHLRGDAAFKMATDRTPSERELCSQSTISRL